MLRLSHFRRSASGPEGRDPRSEFEFWQRSPSQRATGLRTGALARVTVAGLSLRPLRKGANQPALDFFFEMICVQLLADRNIKVAPEPDAHPFAFRSVRRVPPGDGAAGEAHVADASLVSVSTASGPALGLFDT
jgi:hypothetical protein